MTTTNISQMSTSDLTQSLKTAQEALELPEVQAMLRRLAEYQLGIFMPHMHDERTGQFQPLPDEFVQVESDLEVSFRRAEEVASQTNRFLPVGWFWRAGAAATSAACEMVWEEGLPGDDRVGKHKMLKRA